VGRQRHAVAVGQAFDLNTHGIIHEEAFPLSASAMRSTSRSAMACLRSVGQSSTPSAVTRCTVLWSPPKVPVPGLTSFATIQSHCLAARLALAFLIRFDVSAAKPITRRGRRDPGF